MRRTKKIILYSLLIIAISFCVIVYCDTKISEQANGKLYTDVTRVPSNHVALLLGTSKFLSDGRLNAYYANRIEAAMTLMQNNKCNFIIISGDNGNKHYNEPEMMRDDLIRQGVDSAKIYLDYAGFRTLDSVVRLKEVFSQDSVTIISQQFHNERALFIAEKFGINAVGFNADDVNHAFGFKTRMREKLARVKVFIDFFLNVNPKFLGPKVNIP
jgi:SanA protein